MPTVLVWRLAAADHRGVPYSDDRARSVIIGSTEELGDGESEELELADGDVRVWFRALPAGGPDGRPGDKMSRDRVVVEVRNSGRARERVETATGMYRGSGWVVVEDPRRMEVPDPPLDPDDILSGSPLVLWAVGVVERFMVRP